MSFDKEVILGAINSYPTVMKKLVIEKFDEKKYDSKLCNEKVLEYAEQELFGIYLQKWEFDKYFKYSVYYKISSMEEVEANIKTCLIEKKMYQYNEIKNREELHTRAESPSLYEDREYILIKFNIKLLAKMTIDESESVFQKRYPILVCFDKQAKIMEICYDTIEGVYGIDREFYLIQVENWIKNNLMENLEYYDLKGVLDTIRLQESRDGVAVDGQKMMLSSGGEATLEVGKREQPKLPFLDDFKEIISEYKKFFDLHLNLSMNIIGNLTEEGYNILSEDTKSKLREVNQCLQESENLLKEFEEYFQEVDDMSEIPFTILKFTRRNFKVKFIRGDISSERYTLQHYASPKKENQGRSRMDYVRRYIARVASNSTEQLE